LFAHFGSKTEVQLRLLDETAETARKTVVEPAMNAAEGLPRLRAVVERWLGWSEKAGLGGGCPVTGGFFEFDDAGTARIVEIARIVQQPRLVSFDMCRAQPSRSRPMIPMA
jgi:hypothetical protein